MSLHQPCTNLILQSILCLCVCVHVHSTSIMRRGCCMSCCVSSYYYWGWGWTIIIILIGSLDFCVSSDFCCFLSPSYSFSANVVFLGFFSWAIVRLVTLQHSQPVKYCFLFSVSLLLFSPLSHHPLSSLMLCESGTISKTQVSGRISRFRTWEFYISCNCLLKFHFWRIKKLNLYTRCFLYVLCWHTLC